MCGVCMDNNKNSDCTGGPGSWTGKKSVHCTPPPSGTRTVHLYRHQGRPDLYLTPTTCLSRPRRSSQSSHPRVCLCRHSLPYSFPCPLP